MRYKILLNPFSWMHKINESVRKRGVCETARKILQEFGTKLEIFGVDENLANVLSSKPTLVLSNHPAEADLFVLFAALPTRNDLKMIVNANFLNLSEELDKFFIPVYINHKIIRDDKINFRLRFFRLFHKHPHFSKEEEHRKNVESIDEAARRISYNGLVAMFPGAGKEDGTWFSGVGFLVKKANNPDLNIVFAHIVGTSDLDYLRVLPGASKLLSHFKVYFCKEKKAFDYLQLEPKEIAKKLEKEYAGWVKNIQDSL